MNTSETVDHDTIPVPTSPVVEIGLDLMKLAERERDREGFLRAAQAYLVSRDQGSFRFQLGGLG